ncbi:protein of unknown function [Candidatus Hydrogenisulfobacillus filiaventi]|uniref:Uncharacterized protein n=1 Tax=Candidatus Hydrogenisulfobacillus filiaventi TaxID=2707344 RepID=A0A6F8ZGW6_9FIRM|nr:protein of unknown function [Candidatus Hydrogenisulfobacillus filiaventi]
MLWRNRAPAWTGRALWMAAASAGLAAAAWGFGRLGAGTPRPLPVPARVEAAGFPVAARSWTGARVRWTPVPAWVLQGPLPAALRRRLADRLPAGGRGRGPWLVLRRQVPWLGAWQGRLPPGALVAARAAVPVLEGLPAGLAKAVPAAAPAASGWCGARAGSTGPRRGPAPLSLAPGLGAALAAHLPAGSGAAVVDGDGAVLALAGGAAAWRAVPAGVSLLPVLLAEAPELGGPPWPSAALGPTVLQAYVRRWGAAGTARALAAALPAADPLPGAPPPPRRPAGTVAWWGAGAPAVTPLTLARAYLPFVAGGDLPPVRLGLQPVPAPAAGAAGGWAALLDALPVLTVDGRQVVVWGGLGRGPAVALVPGSAGPAARLVVVFTGPAAAGRQSLQAGLGALLAWWQSHRAAWLAATRPGGRSPVPRSGAAEGLQRPRGTPGAAGSARGGSHQGQQAPVGR